MTCSGARPLTEIFLLKKMESKVSLVPLPSSLETKFIPFKLIISIFLFLKKLSFFEEINTNSSSKKGLTLIFEE